MCGVSRWLALTLSSAYPKDPETGAFPTFTPEEGADPIEAGVSKLALPAAALAVTTR